jgi:hypothetical protein
MADSAALISRRHEGNDDRVFVMSRLHRPFRGEGEAMRRRARVLVFLLLSIPARAQFQFPPVGIIDFYGLRTVNGQQVHDALHIAVGDAVMPHTLDDVERRLKTIPGVTDARLSLVCCHEERAMLFVGIAERGAPAIDFHAQPTGSARLPADVVQAGTDLEDAWSAAVLRGETREDDSQGHALSFDSTVHAIQERFIIYAARHRELLRDVLKSSADAKHRALAAQVLGYAADKQAIVPDLVYATRDPDRNTRNDATRALVVIAGAVRGIRIPAEPFIDLLNSVVWTDRNKAAGALAQLTASRDPALLSALRARALPSLIEMARWKSPAHAASSIVILGRIAGLSEKEIQLAQERGAAARVIAAATRH